MAKDGRHSIIEALAEASRQRPKEEGTAKIASARKFQEPKEDDGLEKAKQLLSKNRRDSISARRNSIAAQVAGGGGGGVSALDKFKKAANKQIKQSRRASIFQNQMQDDMRVGQLWNQQLQTPVNRSNAELCERFWAEMKTRLMRHYGSISSAFLKVDTSGDGSISFLEFVEMLRVIHLPLEMRVARAMFEQVSHGHSDLSLEELKTLLMQKTIQKLTRVMQGFNRKQARVRTHMNRFLKYMCRADEVTLMKCVDRMQRKLTMPFCRELWKMLREHLAKIHSDGDLDRASFLKVIQAAVGTRFMAYEVTFLMRVFDRIDGHQRGCIQLRDLMTTLVLLSDDTSNEQKLHLIFDVFDTDFDKCLLYDQIRAMMQCICTHRPIVEENTTTMQAAKHESGLTFQEELTAQDGMRLYECLLWYLQRTAKLDSDIVTWNELWRAFEQQPDVANAALPGHFRIQWVLQPGHAEDGDPDELPDQEAVELHHDNHRGQTRQRSKSMSHHHSALEDGSAAHTPHAAHAGTADTAPPSRRHSSSKLHCQQAFEDGAHGTSGDHSRPGTGGDHSRPGTGGDHPRPGTGGDRPSTGGSAAHGMLFRSRSKSIVGHHVVHPPTAVEAARENRDTHAKFKSAVTDRFLTSLRTSGDIRYSELTEGFKSVEEQLASAKEGDVSSQAFGGSTGSFVQIAALGAVRPASAAGRQVVIPRSERPGSSPATGRHAKVLGTPSASMVRVNSAPQMARPSSGQASQLSRLRGSQTASQITIPLERKLDSQKWGLEAAYRFKLFSTVKAGKDAQRCLMGACGGSEGLGYKCQLCQSQHVMVTAF